MKKSKKYAQMKSSHYYIFWGIATAAVVLGQIYVGSGYRMMSKSVLYLMDSVQVIIEDPSF
tara:strand:- start:627 stop:809 length:183 start_codon:yes stop_codon:yes gene_type:complete